MRRFWIAGSLLVCFGCKMGPNYKQPEFVIPDGYVKSEEPSLPVLDSWWEEYKDPLLTAYILKARDENLDLLKAESNILRARAFRQVTASQWFPNVLADLNGTKTYFSKNGPVFAIGQATGNSQVTSSPLNGLPFSLQVPQVQNLFNALFDASWELDLFGKISRGVERDVALIAAAIEEKNALELSIFAEIARTYIELRSSQERKVILEQLIQTLEEIVVLYAKQYETGYCSLVSLETAQKNLVEVKASYPDIISDIYKDIFLLSVLTGDLPETLVEALWIENALPKIPATIQLGLRSDLVRRRPDVRRVEKNLAAATAEVGVTVASFFPTISILGTGGLQSLQLPQLFNWQSKTWAYGSDISMPVFQGGKLLGNLHLAQAEQASIAYEYQKVILDALVDAETSVCYFSSSQKSFEFAQEMVTKSQSLLFLAENRFTLGLDNRISFLNARTDLLNDRLKMLERNTTVLLSSVSLFKALGAGCN